MTTFDDLSRLRGRGFVARLDGDDLIVEPGPSARPLKNPEASTRWVEARAGRFVEVLELEQHPTLLELFKVFPDEWGLRLVNLYLADKNDQIPDDPPPPKRSLPDEPPSWRRLREFRRHLSAIGARLYSEPWPGPPTANSPDRALTCIAPHPRITAKVIAHLRLFRGELLQYATRVHEPVTELDEDWIRV